MGSILTRPVENIQNVLATVGNAVILPQRQYYVILHIQHLHGLTHLTLAANCPSPLPIFPREWTEKIVRKLKTENKVSIESRAPYPARLVEFETGEGF